MHKKYVTDDNNIEFMFLPMILGQYSSTSKPIFFRFKAKSTEFHLKNSALLINMS